MIDLKTAKITDVQFFDYSHEIQVGENEYEVITEYSANVIIDDCLLVQLSGKGSNSDRISIPDSNEQYYNNAELQDWACEYLDIADVEEFLESKGINNNFNFLQENYS